MYTGAALVRSTVREKTPISSTLGDASSPTLSLSSFVDNAPSVETDCTTCCCRELFWNALRGAFTSVTSDDRHNN